MKVFVSCQFMHFEGYEQGCCYYALDGMQLFTEKAKEEGFYNDNATFHC